MNITDRALLLLTAALFFSLVIERILEIMKSAYDFLEAKNGWGDYWDRNALKIRERLLSRIEKASDNAVYQDAIAFLSTTYLTDRHPGYEGTQVISANWLRNLTIKGVVKLIGAMVGIIVAAAAQIDIFVLVALWTNTPNAVTFGALELSFEGKTWLGYTITGIAMGFGAGPLHALIVALERARAKREPAKMS
ncbi:MAG: hypothetical protein AABY83_10360 [Pseudomonadota bacterium]